MSAEILSIGTELLLGDIVDTNAQFLGQQLARLGIPHYYQTTVGDNAERLQTALAVASERSSLLILTGGLGPTPDDITTETVAEFFGAPLVEHPELLEDIRAKYARRGRQMSDSNRKQAQLPSGAQILYNPIGSASGAIWQPRSGLTVLTFPGVPAEMARMWRDTAVPYLRQQGWGQHVILSRVLKFWGPPEAELAERVASLLQRSHPTVAPYSSNGEVRLRLSARAPTEAEAWEAIAPIERQLRAIGGQDCFGADGDTLASVVGEHLRAAGETVGVAESCTGGGLGEALTALPGSSAYFEGGIVAYQDRIKRQLLGVDPDELTRSGAVSAPVAEQMAAGAAQRLGTPWGLSITGIAGPGGGTTAKPVGLAYIGLATPAGERLSCELRAGETRGRSTIRTVCTRHALDRLRRQLLAR